MNKYITTKYNEAKDKCWMCNVMISKSIMCMAQQRRVHACKSKIHLREKNVRNGWLFEIKEETIAMDKLNMLERWSDERNNKIPIKKNMYRPPIFKGGVRKAVRFLIINGKLNLATLPLK